MKQLVLLILLAVAVTCQQQLPPSFKVIFEWRTIDFQWPSEEERQYAKDHHEYIATNIFPSGIKFWDERMYVMMPRWKSGVPVTLGVTSASPRNSLTAPNLEAFPNWSMQKLGDCSAFQSVHSVEIDPKGRMWVLDTGRSLPVGDTKPGCPARLVILDLENNGNTLRTYNFPDHVADRGITYLNDIVLDHADGVMAYISDNGHNDPGIIVYSLRDNKSWKIRHNSMRANAEAFGFLVGGLHVTRQTHVNGIALSPASSNNRQLYYTPLSSFHLYSIPLDVVKNSNITNIDQHVRELGRKTSQTDGMTMSSTGVLYFGLLGDDVIAMWNTLSTPSLTGQRIITRDHNLTQWPASFAFDEHNNLWCVTTMLQNFLNNRVNPNTWNYRFIRSEVGLKNYQYYMNGTAPELPEITAGADSVRFAFATALLAILVFIAK